MRLSLLLLPLLAALALPNAARASEDEQLWTTANATVKLGDKWRLSQEVGLRVRDDRKGL